MKSALRRSAGKFLRPPSRYMPKLPRLNAAEAEALTAVAGPRAVAIFACAQAEVFRVLPLDVVSHGAISTDFTARYEVKARACGPKVEYEWGDAALKRSSAAAQRQRLRAPSSLS